MQVTGSAGVSAALLLQRLFGGGSADAGPASATSAAGQTLPIGGGTSCNASGPGQAQLAGGTMSAMVSLQTQSPPSASDVASQLIDALDTNGDGVVSAEEIQKGLEAGGSNVDISKAFAAVDTNGDGQISKDELTTAVQTDMDAHKAHHGGHHHRAGEAADALISASDSNNDGQLSLDEIATALGKTSDDQKASLQQTFTALDTNADGKLSKDELAAAIQQSMQTAMRAYAQSAATTAEA
ncbi:MAG: hypothetical protein GC155_15295 [Alphaproteobacteria bacterium]|nr:hypothetical protein [Alphaproteobacteria bacterium]